MWNEGQGKWIGWERKRGKLHELNRWLRGATDTTFIAGQRCPPGRASRGSLRDHVGRGYAAPAGERPSVWSERWHILSTVQGSIRLMVAWWKDTQCCNRALRRRCRKTPRASLFQRVFTIPSGLDPYAFAVSDVYQDLFGEGSYSGKGIYDVDMFEAALARRIPESTLLSHDLLEGIFARSGLVTDIEVVEEFPSRYYVAAARQHRWARGDWQLLPWIFGRGRKSR